MPNSAHCSSTSPVVASPWYEIQEQRAGGTWHQHPDLEIEIGTLERARELALAASKMPHVLATRVLFMTETITAEIMP